MRVLLLNIHCIGHSRSGRFFLSQILVPFDERVRRLVRASREGDGSLVLAPSIRHAAQVRESGGDRGGRRSGEGRRRKRHGVG